MSDDCKTHLETIKKLEYKIAEQKRQLAIANDSLRIKNRELDALHYVWCSGGCESGSHRYGGKITEDIVKLAIRNTDRLVEHWNNKEFRKLYTPTRREGDEVQGIKSEYKDIWFYYSMTNPRKLYHKILKFFSDLVEF